MSIRPVVLLAVAGCAGLEASAQASAPAVDFRRDVQPIFKQYCVDSHGPTQALGNFRLDRRRDAMRAGNISDIAPGNSAASRLYLNDAPGFASALAATPKAATAQGAAGDTPLMYAAFYGTPQSVEQLLKSGADPKAKNEAGATALMWAVGDATKTKLLLDAGAETSVRSDDGRTALVIASGQLGSSAVVKLLLDHGATPAPKLTGDLAPLREAARVGDDAVFRLLLEHGADPNGPGAPPLAFVRTNCPKCIELLPLAATSAAPAAGGALPPAPNVPPNAASAPADDLPAVEVRAVSPTAEAIRAALARSLPLLQRNDVAFTEKTGCVSCHHNSLAALAVATARQNGYRVDITMAARQVKTVSAYIYSWRQRAMEGIGIAGGQDSVSYIVFGLLAEHHPPDPATDAMAYYLKTRQSPDGRWRVAARRPPIESSDFTVTALSMRALQAYGPKAMAVEYGRAIDRAREWLTTASPRTPRTGHSIYSD